MPKGGRFLEIGCGNGYGAGLVCRHFCPEQMDGLDIDPAMIALAVHRNADLVSNRAIFFVADAQHLPYGSGSFDAVFNFGIVHHLERWDMGIKEISRVLKKGGGFYFEEIYPPLYANPIFRYLLAHPRQNRFYSREFHASLKEAGLILLPGYRESIFGILGVAEKNPKPVSSPAEEAPG
jgi:ubiquinone/menaquinone biosynthesis C-methylase UbiE